MIKKSALILVLLFSISFVSACNNDNICSIGEDYPSCPNDCPIACVTEDWLGSFYGTGLIDKDTGEFYPYSKFICTGDTGFLRCGQGNITEENYWNTFSRKVSTGQTAGSYYCDGNKWILNNFNQTFFRSKKTQNDQMEKFACNY